MRVFADVRPQLRERFVALGGGVDGITVVYDKGSVARHTQATVDDAPFHYVAALTAASQRALIAVATPALTPCGLSPGETVPVYRTRRVVWGVERTLVVLVSPRLRQGQRRGIAQHLAKAVAWLDQLQARVQRGRPRRARAALEAEIAARLRGQHLRDVLTVDLQETDGALWLAYTVDPDALDRLEHEWLGRLVLMTDQHAWSTAEIIRAYRGQSVAEGVFRSLKDPLRLALRPQYHWTDQKRHVHAWLCVTAYLLATLVHRTAVHDAAYVGSVDTLFTELTQIRRATVARATTRGRARQTHHLETPTPLQARLIEVLGIPARIVRWHGRGEHRRCRGRTHTGQGRHHRNRFGRVGASASASAVTRSTSPSALLRTSTRLRARHSPRAIFHSVRRTSSGCVACGVARAVIADGSSCWYHASCAGNDETPCAAITSS